MELTLKEALDRIGNINFIYTISPEDNEATCIAYDAILKQIPKLPNLEFDRCTDDSPVYDFWSCPRCDTRYEFGEKNYKHCPECGQAIFWEC